MWFIPKCRAKDIVQRTEAVSGGGIPTVGRAEGESDRRRTFDARPCAHDDSDSAEVRGVASDWLYQGLRARFIWLGFTAKEAKFCGSAFLGTRVFRVHRGPGRDGRSRVHPEAGARGPAVGSDGSVGMSGSPLRWRNPSGSALATPKSRFERLTT